MQLETTRFGVIEVNDDAVITFTQPILGFQEYRRYVLLDGPDESPVKWLQSVESGDLAFILMDPRSVMPDYTVEVRRGELTELAVNDVDELDVYTLLVITEDHSQIRTNLRAPILLSAKHRLGKQTILDRSDYPIQFFLAQAQQEGADAQEVTNARTDA